MPSEREQVAQNLVDTCVFGGLDESYGVNLSKETDTKGKSYWSITFAKAGTLDGSINANQGAVFITRSSAGSRWCAIARRASHTRGRSDAGYGFIVTRCRVECCCDRLETSCTSCRLT